MPLPRWLVPPFRLAGWLMMQSRNGLWISVSANPTVGTGISGFSIKTTVLGSDFAGGILSGRFSTDDQISAIYLNGGFVNLLPTPTPNPSYGNWYAMPALALAPGANVIEFTVDNVFGGNYQGFRAELIAVLTRMRYRSIAQVYEFQGFSQSRCTSCVQEPLYCAQKMCSKNQPTSLRVR
jgi:hypothetical protein